MMKIGFLRQVGTFGSRALSTGLRTPQTLLASVQPALLRITQTLTKIQSLQFPQLQVWDRSPVSPIISEVLEKETGDNTLYMDSVLRKRRLKMKKHKLRKRRRTQRALKIRLGKI